LTDKNQAYATPKLVWVFIITLYAIIGFLYAAGNSITSTGTVTVPNSCTFSGSTPTLTFGSIAAGSSTGTTTVALTMTNAGNVASNVLVFGGNWIGQTDLTANFMVGNTVWAPNSGVAIASANQLTYSPSINTYVTAAAGGGTGTIYFGLSIPQYTAAQNYNQIITVSSSC
jgi:hypothetical protein